jgi:integrase
MDAFAELAQINLDEAMISIKRAKDGKSGDHPLHGDDIRALRRLRREHPHSSWVFVNVSGVIRSRLTDAALVRRAGERAKMPLKLHPHMRRHACGYKLANDGKDTKSLSVRRHRSRPQEYSEHHALRGTGSEPVQGFLVRLTRSLVHSPVIPWYSWCSRSCASRSRSPAY